MSLRQRFDDRIATIHSRHFGQEDVVDIRHEEFRAMTDVFLGVDFNREMLDEVEALQVKLRKNQAILVEKFDAGELQPKEYVDASNELLRATLLMSEQILGANEFQKLFGVSPTDPAGYIDLEMFMENCQNEQVGAVA